jgi:hypothetical protein
MVTPAEVKRIEDFTAELTEWKRAVTVGDGNTQFFVLLCCC